MFHRHDVALTVVECSGYQYLAQLRYISRLSRTTHAKMKSGLPMGCPLKQWAAQWTGAAHCLCKRIIISAPGLHMGRSVGRSCPLTFNLIIISYHGLPRLLDYKLYTTLNSPCRIFALKISETDSPSLEFAHSPVFLYNPLYILQLAQF